ncbi:MAG: hypothetical protein ACRC6T_01345 [Sarcina sp.]
MKIYTTEQIDKMFSQSGNFDEFKEFVTEYGLQEELINITSNHSKKRLETIIALAENPKKKDLCETLLCKIKDAKKNANMVEILRAVYGNSEVVEDIDLETLFAELRKYLKNFKAHNHVQKHEERIANKWIKDLTRVEATNQKSK